MKPDTYKAIVLSETHWDRAWYLPFQEYRIRLVRLIDRLIALLDEDASFVSFMLDGQMAILEDYLAIRPERHTDLERLVKAGRLSVGPWYILADEFLVSPESLVRNLMLGLKMAAEYGPIMREGYTPDSFGHIAQMPQILAGFGVNSCIFWRGFGDEIDELGNEFMWAAPDGSEVLGIHIRDGYHNIANVGYPNRGSDRSAMVLDMELALDQVQTAVDLLKEGARAKHLLLFDGVDHAEANRDIPSIIAAANKILPDTEVVHGTLPEFIAGVRADLANETLKSYTGEFNRGKYAHVLQNVYATRIYLKQLNYAAQNLLEGYTEPLNAWAWVGGADYPKALLWEAWKQLLRNHPHDDICGCSCDEVHREDVQRFLEVDQIGRSLARDAARHLMSHIQRDAQEGVPFVVFNQTGWATSAAVEVTLAFDQNAEFNLKKIVNAQGKEIPFDIVRQYDFFEAELRKNHYQTRYDVTVQLSELPACGYTVLYASDKVSVGGELLVSAESQKMQNAHIAVTFADDGTYTIYDKALDRSFAGLGAFVDVEDAGDEYDYSHCENSLTIDCRTFGATVERVHAGGVATTFKITQSFNLPKSLTEDRLSRSSETIACDVTSWVTLRGNNRFVEVKTVVDNKAKDHRLQVVFPTNIETDVATADGHYDVATRPIIQPEKPDWMQPPVPTKHQRVFVDVSDGEAGLAVFNKGLPEYEIKPEDNAIALTLLRCVDQLFRDDLLTRPGYTWLPLYTPEAQCLDIYTFEYAIAPHAGDWRDIYAEAHQWSRPVYVRGGREQEGFVPFEAVPKDKQEFALFKDTQLHPVDMSGPLAGELSLLTIVPSQVALSSVKRSEDGELLVVRVFNVGDEVVSAEITPFLPIVECWELDLQENKQRTVDSGKGQVEVEIRPKQVMTFGFKLEPLAPKPLRQIG